MASLSLSLSSPVRSHSIAAPEPSSPSSIPPAPASGVDVRRHGEASPIAPSSSTADRGARFTPDARPAPLRASQVLSIAAEEIEWAHTTTETDAASLAARATIESWLELLSDADREVLELRYDPEPWPYWLSDDWQSGFKLVRRMVTLRTHRPPFQTRFAEEADGAETGQIELAIERHGARVMRDIERRADRDFTAALRAYAHARGRVASVLPKGDAR
jgi:hypothetical protein